MPLAYTIFPEQHLILERFKGRVTAQEVQQFIEEVWADEAYDKSYNFLKLPDTMTKQLIGKP